MAKTSGSVRSVTSQLMRLRQIAKEKPQTALSQFDLISKYCALLMADDFLQPGKASPSTVREITSTVAAYLTLREDKGDQLSEYECAILLPTLVVKLPKRGSAIVRSGMRDLVLRHSAHSLKIPGPGAPLLCCPVGWCVVRASF
eukprot:gnl/Dysnectes_brevis/3449_a4359_466.p2 GENE.gnl/Dysnectes_brevis/3449_a4359_466~~gnl/Dysnectes_brevis/3449_a4359_466.p2  ORF type:complete len:144 (-),score=55.56 gnl/Dysnectes_brevis/3449_a4359_466:305-736(-)